MPSEPSDHDPSPLPQYPPGQHATQSLRTVSTRLHRTSSDADSSGSHERSRRASKHSEVYDLTIQAVVQLRARLEREKQRADDAESKLQELTAHLKEINDARVQAMRDAAQAKEELSVYKIQLETAQREIYRAQDVIGIVDKQRYRAEKEAAKNRTKARQLNETIMVQLARDEAYRMGLQEGLERGRHPAMGDYPSTPYEPPRGRDMLGLDDDFSSDGSPPVSAAPETEPEPTPQHVPEPQYANPVRPRSVAPSVRSNNAPSFIQPRRSPLPVLSPLPVNPPTQPPSAPPSVHPSEVIRPVSVRNTTPTPRYSHILPPDNFIPTLDANNRIGLPPPHEFARTPERPLSPQLPILSDSSQEPIRVPAPEHTNNSQQRKRQHKRHSSSGSNSSSSLSHLDILNYTAAARTPMSVIQEVNSSHTASPLPHSVNGDISMRHQPSLSGHPLRPGSNYSPSISQEPQDMHSEPRTRSRASHAGSSRQVPGDVQSDRPRSRASHAGSSKSKHQSQRNSTSTAPEISVQPPSRPHSNKTESLRSRVAASPAGSYRAPLPTLSEIPDHHSHHDGDMPGGYDSALFAPADPYAVGTSAGPSTAGPSTAHSHSKGKSRRRHSSQHQYDHDGYAHEANGYDDDDDAVSSTMSVDTLTTPPAKYQQVEGGGDWSAALDMANHVPIGMYTTLPHGSSSTALWNIPDVPKRR